MAEYKLFKEGLNQNNIESSLPSFELYYLDPDIVEGDFVALKKSAVHIQTITNDSRPDDSFTLEDDLGELKAHKQEFLRVHHLFMR